MIIKLKKPVTIDGKEYKEIKADFEKLTGVDLMQARSELSKTDVGVDNFLPAMNMEYQARVGARAADLPFDVVKQLPAPEFLQLTREVQSFLLGSAF